MSNPCSALSWLAVALTGSLLLGCGNNEESEPSDKDTNSGADSGVIEDSSADAAVAVDAAVADQSGLDTSTPPPDAGSKDLIEDNDLDQPDTNVTIDAGEPTPDVDETKGLASGETLLKILGPSGRDWIQSQGSMTQLSGVLFGGAEQITWASAAGDSGKIEVNGYWQSDIINLKQGDNKLEVTAKNGNVTVSDTVHIVYNPSFSFEGAPQIEPGLLFVNEFATLIVHMPLTGAVSVGGAKPPLDAGTAHLIQVDQDGKEIKDHGALVDNGSASNCDDIQKDGTYSKCLSLTPNVAATLYFRVRADVEILSNKYTAYSPLMPVDVVARMSKAECGAIVALQQQTKSAYLSKVQGGTLATTAQTEAIAALKLDATVKDAGPASDGYGVWVHYKSGRVGALNLAPKETRGGGGVPDPGALYNAALPTYSVGTRRALTLAPFADEFKAEAGAGDEADAAGAALAARECPPFAVDSAVGAKAHLGMYRSMSEYGVVAISGHGDAYFGTMNVDDKKALGWEHAGAQEVLWTGDAVDCSKLSSSTAKCGATGSGCPSGQACVKTSKNGGVCVDHTQGDIMTGRLVIGANTYGILPSFLKRHAVQEYPESIIYLGACRSLWNGSLAVQLFGLGAQAVVGYSDYVSNKFAWEHGKTFFDSLIDEGANVLESMTTTDTDAKWGGRMRYLGKHKANAKDARLINPSWDTGKRTGWKAVGDGRVISRLGSTVPVGGKFMGIISTGLGFTTQTGSLEQPFCVDQGASEMCFHWKFYSEEFLEWCGSAYMDRFTATLAGSINGAQKTLTMVDVWIDPLCPYDCGGKNPCQAGSPSCKCGQQWKGLAPADVSFDQGGVYMTLWQTHCHDITAFSGKRVTLKFFTTDKGDSIYDSAILVDDVTTK